MTDDAADRLDDLEARLDALNRARMYLNERVDDLEAENERLRDRVAQLEEIVDPDPSARDYEQLTKPQKVHRVRRTLVEQAAQRPTGKASMQYDDVRWLFDGQPSAGHCYELMQVAAQYDDETETSAFDGFVYDKHGGDSIRLLANLDAVNDETLLHAANNVGEGGAV